MQIVKGGDHGWDMVVRLGQVLSGLRWQLGDVALNARIRDVDEDRRSRRLVLATSSSGCQASSRSLTAAKKPAAQSWTRTAPSSVRMNSGA